MERKNAKKIPFLFEDQPAFKFLPQGHQNKVDTEHKSPPINQLPTEDTSSHWATGRLFLEARESHAHFYSKLQHSYESRIAQDHFLLRLHIRQTGPVSAIEASPFGYAIGERACKPAEKSPGGIERFSQGDQCPKIWEGP